MDVGDTPGTTPETVPSAAVAVIILNSTSHFRSGDARMKEEPTPMRGEDIIFHNCLKWYALVFIFCALSRVKWFE